MVDQVDVRFDCRRADAGEFREELVDLMAGWGLRKVEDGVDGGFRRLRFERGAACSC